MVFATTEQLYELYLRAGQKVSTDTRSISKDSVFFALKGANFNGNTFAAKAIEAGASVSVVDEADYATAPNIFLVKDVLKALQELANYHRKQFTIPVLAITGSNGKTTNKELIKAVLSKKFKVLATHGNLNNHIGVPLTLLSVLPEHEFAIIEMGANHQGEIAELCNIADPEFGLITNIGKAHLEGFGGIEGVKKGKGEMYVYLRERDAKAFVNGDDEVLTQLAFENDKITYGCKKLYDVIGKDYSSGETVRMKYTTRYGEKDFNKLPFINTKIVGHYNFINCLAAVCVGNYFKVEEQDIRAALESYEPDMNRSQLVKTEKNTIILDAYNANPNSMKEAIDNFAKFPAEKKILFLGDMFELGEYAAEEHSRVVELLNQKGFAETVLVGPLFAAAAGGHQTVYKSTAECLADLKTRNLSGYTVLIKGSRGMKMESLKEAL